MVKEIYVRIRGILLYGTSVSSVVGWCRSAVFESRWWLWGWCEVLWCPIILPAVVGARRLAPYRGSPSITPTGSLVYGSGHLDSCSSRRAHPNFLIWNLELDSFHYNCVYYRPENMRLAIPTKSPFYHHFFEIWLLSRYLPCGSMENANFLWSLAVYNELIRYWLKIALLSLFLLHGTARVFDFLPVKYFHISRRCHVRFLVFIIFIQQGFSTYGHTKCTCLILV